MNRGGVGGVGEFDAFEGDLLAARQRVPGLDRFELAHAAHITGRNGIGGDVFLATGVEELADPILAILGGVVDGGRGRERAGEDAEPRDLANVGIRLGLEGERDEVAVRIGTHLDRFAIELANLGTFRSGREDADDGFHEWLHAEVL